MIKPKILSGGVTQ